MLALAYVVKCYTVNVENRVPCLRGAVRQGFPKPTCENGL